MNRSETASQAPDEVLVVQREADGFSVYAPGNPAIRHHVGGTPEAPSCTCQEFAWHKTDPDYRCPHITAVFQQLNRPDESSSPASPHPTGNGNGAGLGEGGPTLMLLRRSISPDGRINSLSIELTCPFEHATLDDIHYHAEQCLELQSEIAALYLDREPASGAGQPNQSQESSQLPDGPVAAKLTGVEGMQTKWGWRSFLKVEANGEVIKLFASRKQMAEWLTAAGHSQLSRKISDGTQFNAPCRAILRRSDDGRYLQIEKLLPVEGNNGRQRGYRR